MRNLVKLTDYKDVIRSYIAENISVRGYKTLLAKAAKCQKSHFSLVLSSHHHLSSEQALRLADHWGLNELESEYFVCLVELSKTGCERYLQRCTSRLESLREQMNSLSKRFKGGAVADDAALKYYSRMEYQAVHALTAVPEYSTAEKISHRLRLPINITHQLLGDLHDMDLIKKHQNGWRAKATNLHLASYSPFNWVNHYHWRQRAIVESQTPQPNNIHFSAIYAISQEDKDLLKNEIYKLIDKSRKLAIESVEEDVYVLACDWYRL